MVPYDWKKANLVFLFKKSKKDDPENYEFVSPMSVPGKMMEQLIPETISRHMKDKKVNMSSQHEFSMKK